MTTDDDLAQKAALLEYMGRLTGLTIHKDPEAFWLDTARRLDRFSVDRLDKAISIYLERYSRFSLAELVEILDTEVLPARVIRKKDPNVDPDAFWIWYWLTDDPSWDGDNNNHHMILDGKWLNADEFLPHHTAAAPWPDYREDRDLLLQHWLDYRQRIGAGL